MADPAAGSIAAVLVDALGPAADVFTDPVRFASVLHAVDPALDFDVDALASTFGDLAGAAAAITAAVDGAAAAAAGLDSDDPGTSSAAAGALLGHAETIVAEILSVAAVVRTWDADDLGIEDADGAFWAGVAAGLVERLLVDQLESRVPALYGLLRAVGLVVEEPDGRVALRIDRLGDLIGDPAGLLADVTGWGTGLIDPDWFTGTLADSVGAVGLPVRVRPLRPEVLALLPGPQPASAREVDVPVVSGYAPSLHAFAELGLIVAAVSLAGGTEPDALLVTNLTWGAASHTFTTASGWSLTVTAAADRTGLAAAVLAPGEVRDVSAAGAADLSIAVAKTADPPWRPVGTATSTRIEVGGVHAAVELGVADRTDVTLVGGLDDAHLVIVPTSAFLATVLGANQVDVALSLEARWSALSGLSIGGLPGLSIVIPINRSIGPVDLFDLEVTVGAGDGGSGTVQARLDAGATLGPFAVTVEGIGIALALGPPDTSAIAIGPVGFGVEALPPTGIGLAMEGEAISGEGLLHVDGDRYVGGISVDVLTVGIDAFTIIDTSLPGDPDGFALLATLTLRFPGIPLGFGFMLTGLGGILALNRSVDAEALALGLRDGAVDAILFPEDLLRDIDVLVDQLDEYFPICVGNTVVGPVAEITWGAPTIITGQLAVAISLPQGVILALGSIAAVLPDPDAPILELHLDTLGALDLPGGTLLVVASLYDSRLLGVIELSGDAAIYVSWLDDPYFVLSVGGFHPGFQPPAHVPAVLETLRRMRAAIDIGSAVSASFESYFAVTSNTVQFGGGFDIEASAEFLLTTYSARGWFDFDVLLRFSPFLIMADVSAGVGVYAGDKELMGVQLSVHVEGPKPWFASGDARFTFFGIKVTFDFVVGGHAAPAVAASADVLDLVRDELANPAAWSTERVPGVTAGLLIAGEDAETLVRPDDRLVARQTVAPLGRTIARFGELTPEQSEVEISSTTVVDGTSGDALGDVVVDDALDWFAPALYDVLPETARLSAPSYEQMVAGVGIGATGVAVPGDNVTAPAGHETEVWQPDTGRTVKLGVLVMDRALTDTVAASAGGRTASVLRGTTVDGPRVAVAGQSYVVIDPVTGLTTSSDKLHYAAARADAAALGGRVVPA